MSTALPPGSKLGVLGSGQLGRMFAIAARRLGYGVHVFSPEADSPTAQVADKEFVADYDNLDEIEKFAKSVSVITFEFENVPAASTDVAQKYTRVAPCVDILKLSQNRNREKSSLAKLGIPVPAFQPINSQSDFAEAVEKLGRPSVLKTATMGYDGKGQQLITDEVELDEVWLEYTQASSGLRKILGTGSEDVYLPHLGQESILEEFVDFELELSVVGARGMQGDFEACGPILNRHENHILDVSILPAGVDEKIAQQAIEITRSVMEEYKVVGLLCIEFFLTRDGRLLVNEVAPRPHNSGHLSVDACVTCQFEQQVRAITGLPLGSFESFKPAAMANVLGDLWEQGEPNWAGMLSENPDVKLHLYGKASARVGRKMGHLTLLNDSAEVAAQRVKAAHDLL